MTKAGQTANAGPPPATQVNERNKYGLRSKDAPAPNTAAQKQQSTLATATSTASTSTKQPHINATPSSGRNTPTQRNEAVTFQVIAEALDVISTTHRIEEKTKIALAKLKLLAKQGAEDNSTATGQQQLAASIKALHNFLKADLDHWRNSFDAKLERIAAEQSKILTLTESTAKDTESLKAATAELKANVGKVNDSTAKFANTAESYRDALLANASPPAPGSSTDPRILSDMERKAKQVLIIFQDATVGNKSQTDLKDKANEIIASLSTLSPPSGAKVENVLKLRNGGAILQLNSKETANWIRDFSVETEFTKAFAEASYFKDRHYNILVPRVPLTFDPSNQAHLREVEEANGLSSSTIIKARWIKPEYRRSAGQQVAHLSLTISTAATANKLIREGFYICNSRITPTKLKQEPLQCMKCRGWGHIAASCLEAKDTCGTCGGEHQTRNCTSPDKTYCVSCKSDTHASWDRKCPEFLRRCARHNDRHPENSMTYFPTEEQWTLTVRPDRIPLDERFPSKYAVASLPPPNNKQRLPPTRSIAKQPKHPRKTHTADLAPEQATLDKFLQKSHPQQDSCANQNGKGTSEIEDLSDQLSDILDEATNRLLNDGAIHEITGWN